jgi:nucleoside-diphosphate-sugar epimerase
VTGGDGFIGSSLVRRLVKDGSSVRVLDNGLRGNSSRLAGISGSIESVRADIRNQKAVKEACRGIDSVFHLAYLNGTEFFYSKPDLVLDIGVKGMVSVIDACIDEGIKELVLLSSSEVYQAPPEVPTGEKVPLTVPDPLNPRYSYGAGKIISELMVINYGRKYFNKVVIARPHNVYGPDMGWEHVIPQFIVRMKELGSADKDVVEFPIQGDGSQTRAFCFIDDFIDGLMLAAQKGEHLGIYNIGTPEEISIGKVAIEVGNFFGKRVRIVPGKAPEGGVSRRCPDVSKLKRLGYSPKVQFTEGLRRTAEWYEKNIGLKPEETLRSDTWASRKR